MSENNIESINSKRAILLKGIYPPIPTSFDQQGRIAVDGLQRNLSYLSRYDLKGFVVLGSNGEFVMLGFEEKLFVMEMARAAIPEDKFMIAGTGCQSTEETAYLTQKAAELGVDAALVITPSYYRKLMTPEVLIKHYRMVADHSPIPIIIYNMPACTGIDLEAELVCVLARHPNIIGLKDSSGNLAKLGTIRQEAGPGFQLLAGSGGFLLPALSVGALGGVLALANIAPEQCVAVLRHFTENRFKDAQALQNSLTPLNTLITSRWGVPALKAAMDALGLYGGPVRLPLEELPPENKKIVEAAMVRAGIK
jgi:4-hydroxy-2-oxoglutarate aldolase